MTKQPSSRYLECVHMPINYANVVANTAFRVKIPQSGVCAFLVFYVQSKTNNDTYKSRFAINF